MVEEAKNTAMFSGFQVSCKVSTQIIHTKSRRKCRTQVNYTDKDERDCSKCHLMSFLVSQFSAWNFGTILYSSSHNATQNNDTVAGTDNNSFMCFRNQTKTKSVNYVGNNN